MANGKPPVIALDDLTEAATAGVMRALQGRALAGKDVLRGPIIIGIVMQPPEMLQSAITQQGKQ